MPGTYTAVDATPGDPAPPPAPGRPPPTIPKPGDPLLPDPDEPAPRPHPEPRPRPQDEGMSRREHAVGRQAVATNNADG